MKNIRNDFGIPTHLSGKQGNPESENNIIHAFAGIFQLWMLLSSEKKSRNFKNCCHPIPLNPHFSFHYMY